MAYYDRFQIVLPPILPLTLDDGLPPSGWALRSEPFLHLAMGQHLLEEVKGLRGELSPIVLADLLGVEVVCPIPPPPAILTPYSRLA